MNQDVITKLMDLKKELEINQEINKQQNILSKLPAELQQKIVNKEKLTINEQVDYLKAKGIKFNITTEIEALEYLANNSYYYKIAAYKHNFPKNTEGLYINLDFAHLKDIAIIDMHLRYLLIKLSLDIEHALKTKIIRFITEDPGENGFSIIEEYNDYEYERFVSNTDNNKDDYIHVKDKIFKEVKNKRDYNYDTYTRGNFPIWKLIEMMSYGQLSSFIKFYVEKGKYKSKQFVIANKFLHYSKNVRDSAAHSRPLLLNIVEVDQFKKIYTDHHKKKSQAQPELKRYVETSLLKRKRSSELITNFRIHDLCCLIYLHDEYVKGKFVRKARKRELFNVYKRALYKRNLYQEINQFDDILKLFYGIIRKYKS